MNRARGACSAGGEFSGGYAVRTHRLTKRFRSGQVAVNSVDLAVPRGCVYGFLGPNGSGKTTTIRMLLGLIRPTAGGHELLGMPMPGQAGRVLPAVGSLVEGPAFHPYLSGPANLRRLDAADRTADPRTTGRRIAAALDRVGLSAAGNKRYRNYSLGMRQRLAIAAALLRPRELLVLDEPTNGLDPQGTREVRSLVTRLSQEGVTVLLSTHLLSEVEQVCTHVGVMRAGSLITQSSLVHLRGSTGTRLRVETSRPEAASAVLIEHGLDGVVQDRDGVLAELGSNEPETLVPALVRADVPVRGFACVRPTLEDLFVSLTGEGFDVDG